MTDPIADLITRLKNAGAVGKKSASVPHSDIKLRIAEKLRDAGYVKSVSKKGKKVKQTIDIELRYLSDADKQTHRIHGAVRASKPSRRMYEKVSRLRPVKGGKGAFILSTPKGILTDREARKENVGGEVLFKIW